MFAIETSPTDAKLIVSGGEDDRAFLWRADDSATMQHELLGHSDSVVVVSFSFDGQLLDTGGMDGIVKIWSTKTGQLVHSLEGPSASVGCLSWHPRGTVVVAGSEDGSIWMWGAAIAGDQGGQCMQVFGGHTAEVTAVSFTPDGKHLVSAAADAAVLYFPKMRRLLFATWAVRMDAFISSRSIAWPFIPIRKSHSLVPPMDP